MFCIVIQEYISSAHLETAHKKKKKIRSVLAQDH